MPDYRVHLHDGASVAPVTEIVVAADDVEARTLAEMRLLLGRSSPTWRFSFRIDRFST